MTVRGRPTSDRQRTPMPKTCPWGHGEYSDPAGCPDCADGAMPHPDTMLGMLSLVSADALRAVTLFFADTCIVAGDDPEPALTGLIAALLHLGDMAGLDSRALLATAEAGHYDQAKSFREEYRRHRILPTFEQIEELAAKRTVEVAEQEARYAGYAREQALMTTDVPLRLTPTA